jgi:HK97 family phage major capsid protein
MDIQELRQRLQKLNDEALALKAKAEAEKRDLTTEEAAQLDQVLDASDRCAADIERCERLSNQTERLRRPTGRRTQPEQPTESGDADTVQQLGRVRMPERVPAEARNYALEGTGGFRSLGDMAVMVARACRSGGLLDPRLERLAAPSTYGNEGSGADGGFAIPVEFRNAIMTTVMGEDSLLTRCDQITVAGNTFTQPIDEATPWQTSGGILANWDGEAVAGTQSKPALGERTVKLNKLRVLVPLTEEILEDSSAMDGYLRRKAPDKINFKVNAAIVAGTGVGIPLGLLNSPGKVKVTKESGQQTGTIVGNNIIKMYNRMYGPCRSRAVWLYNQEVEPQLYKLAVPGTDNTGNAVTGWGGLIYMPPGGLSSAPYGTLFGRPAIPTQACSALSTEGDIIFVDLSQYLVILKGGPNPKTDISVHLWFDQDITAFKFTLRMGGITWWSTAATALNGSNTYSPYVTLESR